MIENPFKKYSAKCSTERFFCELKSDDENDIKVIKRLAQQSNCTKPIYYKDYFEHCIKIRITFKKAEDKMEFMQNVISKLRVCEKLKRHYA